MKILILLLSLKASCLRKLLVYVYRKGTFSVCEKIMQICQNRPLEKFVIFIYAFKRCMHCKHMAQYDTNLCNRRLTHIIRINKTPAEKCTFMVPYQSFVQDFLLGGGNNMLNHCHLGRSGGMPPLPWKKISFKISFQACFDQKLVLISK